MGLVALLLMALAGWLIWTGRLQRMTGTDGLMLGLALAGAVMAVKGKPLIGALPVIVSLGYAMMRQRAGRPRMTPPDAAGLEEARALLGVPRDADAETIRAAHRRLIAAVHPDKGGTQALAAKINAARDMLLRHKDAT